MDEPTHLIAVQWKKALLLNLIDSTFAMTQFWSVCVRVRAAQFPFYPLIEMYWNDMSKKCLSPINISLMDANISSYYVSTSISIAIQCHRAQNEPNILVLIHFIRKLWVQICCASNTLFMHVARYCDVLFEHLLFCSMLCLPSLPDLSPEKLLFAISVFLDTSENIEQYKSREISNLLEHLGMKDDDDAAANKWFISHCGICIHTQRTNCCCLAPNELSRMIYERWFSLASSTDVWQI